MGCFLWKQEFVRPLAALSPTEAHSRAELEKALGADYIGKTARSYGIHFGGRALNIEEEYGGRRPLAELSGGEPCENLLSGGHFHVDLEGYFIPPGCTGLRLPLGELVRGIPGGKYPVFEALYHRGLAGLLSLAREAGFTEDPQGYASKCALCFHARRHLSQGDYAELDKAHYEESLKYYKP